MLHDSFLDRPIAHRALHGQAPGCPENSRPAILAAVEQGYGIEIDLQLSADGEAMVFHDATLDRLTDHSGAVRDHSAKALGAITLKGAGGTIPTLTEVLSLVAGRAPLLIEIKDQHGALGAGDTALEQATARALKGYEGPAALMSFNPHSMAEMARLLPEVPRGLTTCGFTQDWFKALDEAELADLRAIKDYKRVGASFISHHFGDLANPAVRALWDDGHPVLSWTIRTPEEEAEARRLSDNVTFEGYKA